LEQLAAEWYEYSGYFVRTNIKFGKREKGGYEGEIDIAAFEPTEQKFVHIETSMDADSWDKRTKRFKKKFDDAAGYYDSLFPFDKDEITKIAIVGFAQNSRLPAEWPGDIEAVSIPSFVSQICQALRDNPPLQEAIPESFPLLRAMQFAIHYCSNFHSQQQSGGRGGA
jgi:hypothetical protein